MSAALIVFLVVAAWLALGVPLGRRVHRKVLTDPTAFHSFGCAGAEWRYQPGDCNCVKRPALPVVATFSGPVGLLLLALFAATTVGMSPARVSADEHARAQRRMRELERELGIDDA